MCCAGITEDTGDLLRLYPIRFRRLKEEERFTRFDLVEMTITKTSSDSRPESYRVDEDSIHLIKDAPKLTDEQKVMLWKPHIAPSIKDLLDDNRQTGRSLGIIRPDPGSLKFIIGQPTESDSADQAVAELVYKQQMSFLEEPLKPLERPKYSFSYQFTCAGHPHRHQIHDWEVQTTFINYRKRYGSEAEDLKMMTQEYQERIPQRNLHFIMGTMKMHPKTFILIGLLRTGVAPEDAGRQEDLFGR